jgi:hypothetical protein
MIINIDQHGGNVAVVSDSESSDDRVDVVVPLGARFASMLRVVTASLGVDAGFSIDEIDDFKLAVSEVFALLVTGHRGDRALASFTIGTASVSVDLSLESGDRVNVQPDPLAITILTAVVDSYVVGESAIQLVKHAVETSAING